MLLKNCSSSPCWRDSPRPLAIFEFLPLFASSSSDIHVAASHSDVRRATTGRKKREEGGGAGRTRRGSEESAVQVNYYPQHGENISDDRDRHGGEDICARRPLSICSNKTGRIRISARINLGAIFNKHVSEPDFRQCKKSVSSALQKSTSL